ncbi:MAG: CRISPR-associated endonuclease Cas2 [Chloroflexota bacterium]|nr:CRISPR-associated endonuclease Cas2 [Chloroflexota bacterium]
MQKQFIVVAYDISDDKRRTRLHDLLEDYGTPVQYSVFECLVTPKQLEQMQRRVRQKIKVTQDAVRYYRLCEACRGKIEVTSAGREVTQEVTEIIV